MNLSAAKANCPNLMFSLDDAMDLTPGCVWMKQTQMLGKGEDGEVYLVCKECDKTGERICQFSVKHIQRKESREEFKKKVIAEVTMHKKAQLIGIAPEILDAFICGDNAFIVMEKKDYNLVVYLEKMLMATRDLDQVLSMLEKMRRSAVTVINQLHGIRLVHGDAHLRNFMIDLDPENPSQWRNMQVIDLSKAELKSSPAEADREEPLAEIAMSFNLLKRELTEMYNHLMDTENEDLPVRREAPQAPRKQRRKMDDDDVEEKIQTPIKISKMSFSDDETQTPVKRGPLSFDEDDGYKTPIKGNQLSYDDEEDGFQTPVKGTQLSFDEDDGHQTIRSSFPVRGQSPVRGNQLSFEEYSTPTKNPDEEETRYHSYRYSDTEDQPYEEMIDDEYYINDDYDPDEEWIQQIPDQ